MKDIQQLQAELEATKLAYAMAKEMSQIKSAYLGRVSHELRSPVSSLMGLFQLILSDFCESQEEEREVVKQSYVVAENLIEFIDEITLISKLEYGAISLKVQPINLSEIITRLDQHTKRQAANRNISLQISVPAPEIAIMTDAERCLQGLVMLVDTAIDQLETGIIQVSSIVDTNMNYVQIFIDFPGEISHWQAGENFFLNQPPEPEPQAVKKDMSSVENPPDFKFFLVQNLFEKMGGTWQLSEKVPGKIIRLKGEIPLALPVGN